MNPSPVRRQAVALRVLAAGIACPAVAKAQPAFPAQGIRIIKATGMKID